MKYNNNRFKIKTSSGYVNFQGVAEMGKKVCFEIEFSDKSVIQASRHHRVFTPDGRPIEVCELSIGTEVLGLKPNMVVTNITRLGAHQTYDIIESETHHYYSNGVLHHNCQFLTSDALLIDSKFLADLTMEMASITPVATNHGVIFWQTIERGKTYLVGVDPSTGSGEDYSVITVFEFPSLVQVAEWRKNTMSTNGLYGVLKGLLTYLERMETVVYFSVENNGVGEGVISLYEADEEPPVNSEFVSEEGAKRRGLTTTNKSKMKACVNLKEMLEKRTLTIKSNVLLAELKAYARSRGSYNAQTGSTDDSISAVLIIIRLLSEISQFDQDAFDKLYSSAGTEIAANNWDDFDEGDGNHNDYDYDPIVF
jgi:hypothetical protein